MTELLSGVEAPTDAELISRVRGGDLAAYGELFARHVDAANRLGRQLVRGPDADDLVSEAFSKVMGVLQNGGGPDVAFRAYLLTSVRRLHVDKIRATQRVQPSDDMEAFDPGVPFTDTAVAGFESGAAARAFQSLPERWQLVLWHLEVEGQKPAEIAPLLGMSANSVSALAYRAREGLRQAFLTMHLADTPSDNCRWVNDRLGPYVRDGLSKRDSTKVRSHLDECRRCTALYLELTEVNSNLSAIIAPLVLGAAAAGYLSSTGAAGSALFGLTSVNTVIGRVRDGIAANASAVTAGAVAASVTAAASIGFLVVTEDHPEEIIAGVEQTVTQTLPAPAPELGEGLPGEPSAAPSASAPGVAPAPEKTPAEATEEPVADVAPATAPEFAPSQAPVEPPAPAGPEPVQPEPVQPEPVQPEPTKPAPVEPEPTKPVPAEPEPTKPGPAQPEPTAPVQPQPSPPVPTVTAPPPPPFTPVPDPTPTTDPDAKVKTTLTPSNRALVDGTISFDLTPHEGQMLPISFYVDVTPDDMGPGGRAIEIADGGSCTRVEEADTDGNPIVRALCTPSLPSLGTAGLRAVTAPFGDALSSSFRVVLPLSIPEGQSPTTLTVSIALPPDSAFELEAPVSFSDLTYQPAIVAPGIEIDDSRIEADGADNWKIYVTLSSAVSRPPTDFIVSQALSESGDALPAAELAKIKRLNWSLHGDAYRVMVHVPKSLGRVQVTIQATFDDGPPLSDSAWVGSPSLP